MTQSRNILLPLLLAGIACAQAQPIVRINPVTNDANFFAACDVINPTAPNIFTIDPATGNVIITGKLVLASDHNTQCKGGSTGTNPGDASFTTGLGLGQFSFIAPSSTSFSYAAANATSCSVTAGAGTGAASCPALNLTGGSCSNGATQAACSGSGTVSENTALANNTSCSYTLTASCLPASAGPVISTAQLTVNGQTVVSGCPNLHTIATDTAGQVWTQATSVKVVYPGGATANGVDATQFLTVWEGAFPSQSGFNTKVTVLKNQYLAERFTVPTDGSLDGITLTFANVGSGTGTIASYAISTCPGDFGQTGTSLRHDCVVQQNTQSGIGAIVSATDRPGYCTLSPGQTYYLNILSMADPPGTNNQPTDTSFSSCTSSCTPFTVRY